LVPALPISFGIFASIKIESMLVHAHSGLRWVALLLLIFAIYNAFSGVRSGSYSKKDKMVTLFTMVMFHIQLVLGLALYFTSANVLIKNSHRMEHLVGMILAILFVTLGYSLAKRIDDPIKKHKKTLIYFTIGLFLVLIFIPWPFRIASAHWF